CRRWCDAGGWRTAPAAAAASAARDHRRAGGSEDQPFAASRKNQPRQSPAPYVLLARLRSLWGRSKHGWAAVFHYWAREGANLGRKPSPAPLPSSGQRGTAGHLLRRSREERPRMPSVPRRARRGARGVRREPNWDEDGGEAPRQDCKGKGIPWRPRTML